MNPAPGIPHRFLHRFHAVLVPMLAAVLLLGQSSRVLAAFETRGGGAAPLGTGCSYSADPFHPSGRETNPAAAAWSSGWALAGSYARPFDLKEFDRVRIDAVLPLPGVVAGISASSFGSELYSERSLSLTASHRVTPWLAAGLGLGRAEVAIEHYGSDSAWMLDAGLLLHTETFDAALACPNLAATRLERYSDTPLPRQGIASLRLHPGERLTLLCEVRTEKGFHPGYGIGAEMKLFPSLTLRTGYETETERLHIGLGITVAGGQVDGSYDHHSLLGWSKAFGFSWGSQPDDN